MTYRKADAMHCLFQSEGLERQNSHDSITQLALEMKLPDMLTEELMLT